MASEQKTVLVTGGAGYIGSHIAVELLSQGYHVVIVDSLVNSSVEALSRIQAISNRALTFYEVDVRDEAGLSAVFQNHRIDGVIHMAGLKAVGESVAKPLTYYDANINGFLVLAKVMQDHDVFNLVFSSSATVYGDADQVPIQETASLKATNPYGRCKLMIEEMIIDLAASDARWKTLSLRYFNPVGAHESAQIGEDPAGIPNNLFPFIAQVAVGRREKLSVFGGDYDTVDGTGVRDYIHVCDLALGHLKAVEHLFATQEPVCEAVNLGTGNGYSVLQAVAAWKRASNRDIPYEVVERRPGDVAQNFADASKAQELLNWKAERDLNLMCASHWQWQHQNPQGYVTPNAHRKAC